MSTRLWQRNNNTLRTPMQRKKNRAIWILGLLVLVLLGPLLQDHLRILWGRQHYQWFPLLLGVVVFLFLRLWRKAEPAEDGPSSLSLGLGLLLCVFLTAVAYLYYTGWVATVAAIGVIGLLAAYLSGIRRMPGLFAVWALLFLLVRLPNQIEKRLLNLFESLSSKIASVIIDQSGTYHVVQGHLLVIDGYEIELDKICNGFFSVVSMVAVACLYALWRKRPCFHVALLIGSAFAVATVVNVLRIATVGIVYGTAGWDLMDSGWVYVMLVASFAFGLLALMSCDALYSFFLQPVATKEKKKDGRGLVKVWNAIVGFRISKVLESFRKPHTSGASAARPVLTSVLALCLLCLTAFEASVLYYRWGFGDYQTYFMHDKEKLAIIDPADVQFARPGWKLLDVQTEAREFSSLWGTYSFVWRLEYHDTMVIMSLDYPFDKWHDVKVCYGNLGWKLEAEGLLMPESYKNWGASETEMSLPTGDYGFILCSHCDHMGKPVQPKPTAHQFDMVMYYLHPKQWTAPYGISVDRNQNTFYQTQVMVTAAFPLDEPTKNEIREMYGEFREQTRALIEKKSGE